MPSIKSTFVDGSSSFGGARGSVSAEARNERKAILLMSMDRYFLGVIFASVILLIVAFALGNGRFETSRIDRYGGAAHHPRCGVLIMAILLLPTVPRTMCFRTTIPDLVLEV